MRARLLVAVSLSCVAQAGLAQADSTHRTVDEWLAQSVRRPAWVRTGVGHSAASAVSFVGGATPLIAAGMWTYGARSPRSNAHDAGRSATEAVVASAIVTQVLKAAFGRARPYVTGDTNSRDFRWGRGLWSEPYQSFPSGHATVAFAMAAALSQESARVNGRRSGVDIALYGGASLVALSRMMLDKHWFTDVLLGAAIGTASGIAAAHLSH